MAALRSATTTLLVSFIRLYQLVLSPWIGPSCRFAPSCSEYCREAIERHGPLRGSSLGLRRLLRCHPFGGHGYDPVPPTEIPRAATKRGDAVGVRRVQTVSAAPQGQE